MADLISIDMVTSRLGPNVPVDVTQVGDFISDATALVRDAAEGALDATDHTSVADDFPTVVPVVVSAVRRMLVNPDGFGSEMLDGYRFEQASKSGVFLTKLEWRTVRKAAGLLSAKSVNLNVDVPTPKTEATPEEEIGWVKL